MFDVQPTPYDVSFRIFGFPVRVHPFFWLVIALLGARGHIHDMGAWLLELAVWIAAAFIAILVHELGHALVFRHIYGTESRIVFHAMGGATTPVLPHRRRHGVVGTLCEVLLFFAGPLAGFLLAALCFGLLAVIGMIALDAPETIVDVYRMPSTGAKEIVALLLLEIGAISIFWGIFNLLPIHPMDGGRISREIFCYFSPRHGVVGSLMLSIVLAVGVGVLAFSVRMFFAALLFAFFAYENYRELSTRTSWRR